MGVRVIGVKRCGLEKECETGKSFVGRKKYHRRSVEFKVLPILEMEKLKKDQGSRGSRTGVSNLSSSEISGAFRCRRERQPRPRR